MKLRSVTAGALATAMLATSAAPAAAQVYPGYGYGYGQPGYGSSYDRYRRRDNTGAVIAGVAAIGVIAAIAAAASNRNSGRYNGYSNYDGYRGDIRNENEAAQACANAAQGRLGGRVSGIDQVYRTREGFAVSGTVERGGNGYGNGYGRGYGNGYGGGYNSNQGFTCEVRYGRVASIGLGRYGY